ncbi:MAG: DUF4920 domain-containing protein [Taibaiella sp.]|jgi:hypothetical protein
MKKIITAAAIFALSACTPIYAQDADRPSAKPGQAYGAEIDTKGAVDISQLPSMLESKEKVQTKITAKVLDVCPKKGCWMNLYINDSTTAFVKMKDYGFFVPMDMIGKTVVLEGEAFVKMTSVNELRHYAEDAQKPQSEIDAITEPQKSIRFTATGIKVPE